MATEDSSEIQKEALKPELGQEGIALSIGDDELQEEPCGEQ